MTRVNFSTSSPSPGQAGRVAGVHEVGGSRRVAIVERHADEPGGFRVIAAKSFSLGDAPGLTALLKAEQVRRVIRIAPSVRTVARFVPAPPELIGTGASAEGFTDALSLIAEAELPADAAASPGIAASGAHRRSAGVILGSILVAGWLCGSSDAAAAPLSGLPETWTSVPAALAVLLMLAGNGGSAQGRAHGVAAWADDSAGVVSLIARGERGAVARVVRLSAEGAPIAQSGLERLLAETRQAAGIAPTAALVSVDSHAPGAAHDGRLVTVLAASDALSQPGSPLHELVRLGAAEEGTSQGASNAAIARFGVAAAAAVLGSSADPHMSGLAAMTFEVSHEPQTRVQRVVEHLARPKTGFAVVGACVAALLLLPLAVAAGRLAVLQARVGSESQLRQHLDEARRRSAYVALLGSSRWPMSKLLADAARAAPVGVVLDSFELAAGDGLTVRGSADSADLVTAFSRNLADSGVFSGVITPTVDSGSAGRTGRSPGRGVEFQLRAKVSAPLLPAARLDDYVKQSLAMRLYGTESTDGTSSRATSDGDSRRGGSRSFGRGRDSRDAADSSSGGSVRPDRVRQSGRPADASPPALIDEQIAAMDRTTAMKEWAQRTAAAAREQDPAVKERLKAEADKCKARMQAAPREGGGS